MKDYISKGICLFFIILITSCSMHNDVILDALERIKEIGNENPGQALLMLDSLKVDVQDESEYVRNKYDLLSIRLNDKADNMPVSDIAIKKLMGYFEAKGSVAEKQEVYYYAGSTYRDLQDTPRALEYFFRSLDYAKEHGDNCDPIMLRNTYSNLCYLYYRVQDYKNAVKMGISELESCRQTHTDVTLPFVHIGAAYLSTGDSLQAEVALDSAYSHIVQSEDISPYREPLVFLIYNYACIGSIGKARKCASMIKGNSIDDSGEDLCMAFAWYYDAQEMYDSAAIFCRRVLEEGKDNVNMYDASKNLFRMCRRQGDAAKACKYAETFMQLSDSLDLGKRQELAATVNNQYQYHLDQKKEQKLRDEKERYKYMLVYVCMAALLLACIGYIIHIMRMNRQLHVIAKLSTNLQNASKEGERLRLGILEKEAELAREREKQKRSEEELAAAKLAHERIREELEECNEQIKADEHLLAVRLEQNQAYARLIHMSELEEKAEDVAESIKQSAKTKQVMKNSEWKKLYRAVDKIWPNFRESLREDFGRLTEKQMQFCYLLRIGISKAEAQAVTGLSRITVWRWMKRFSPVLVQGED